MIKACQRRAKSNRICEVSPLSLFSMSSTLIMSIGQLRCSARSSMASVRPVPGLPVLGQHVYKERGEVSNLSSSHERPCYILIVSDLSRDCLCAKPFNESLSSHIEQVECFSIAIREGHYIELSVRVAV
jgi:hypothetical protein